MSVTRTNFNGTPDTVPAPANEPIFNSAFAITGAVWTYRASGTINGQPTCLEVAPSGSGIRIGRAVISTREISMQYAFRAPTTGGSAPLWLGIGTTRVMNIGMTSGRQLQVTDAQPTTSTVALVLTGGADYEIDLHVKVHPTVAAQGIIDFQIRAAGSAVVLDEFHSTTANLGTALLTTASFIAATTSSTMTTVRAHTAAFDPVATTYIAPWFLTVPPATGPLGKLVHIGDSTSSQDGNGVTDIPAAYVAAGWLAGDIRFIGVGSKTFHLVDNDGKTTLQNIQEARAALTEEPAVWVIGLGTNYRFEDDATTDARLAPIMAEINSVGSPGRVLIVGISQATANGGLDTNSIRRNNRIRALMATYPNLYHTDLDAYLRNGRSEVGLWADPIDANFAHMSSIGYALRNAFVADQAKRVVSNVTPWDSVYAGPTKARAVYVGGVIVWTD